MNAKAFVGFLCAMITIIDIIMQVLEHVEIQNLIGVQASPPLLSEAKAVGGTCLFQ